MNKKKQRLNISAEHETTKAAMAFCLETKLKGHQTKTSFENSY